MLNRVMKNSLIKIAKFLGKSRPARAGLLALIVFGFLVLPPELHARIYVRIGPPAIIAETPPPPPGPTYVWIGGHWRWNGHKYVWVSGHYSLPPPPLAKWVPGHWVESARGWYWVEGHWVR
jgi:hypothetical protein